MLRLRWQRKQAGVTQTTSSWKSRYPGLADPHERKVRKDKGTRRTPAPPPTPGARYVARHGRLHAIEDRDTRGRRELRYVTDTELAALGLVPQ